MKKLTILLTVLAVFTLSGCEKEATVRTELVVGTECNYAPFNWNIPEKDKSETSKPIKGSSSYCDGYDIRIATKMAEDLGLDLVIDSMGFTGLIPALTANKIDVIIAAMSPTAERKETISFTNPYYHSEQVVVVAADSPYATATSLADLSGIKLIAQQSTLQDDLIPLVPNVIHGTPLSDYSAIVLAVKTAKAGGFIAEEVVAEWMVSKNPELAMVYFEEGKGFDIPIEDLQSAIGLRKEDADLLASLNETIASISVEVREQWMAEEVEELEELEK